MEGASTGKSAGLAPRQDAVNVIRGAAEVVLRSLVVPHEAAKGCRMGP